MLADLTEPELRLLMNRSGRAIEAVARGLDIERPHFTLLLWNDPAVAQYMSNCERTPMIAALKETLARLEAKEDVSR